ncbi:MAG: hypothetical protein L3K09_08325, partial [Thermoplasmata archaeon]|nr:hypothetical protein [Thermoplasmata archaeon]
TTISGPPLALYFRNQGLSKDEFRATIAQVRVAESSLTLATYLFFTQFFSANLVTLPSLGLLPYLFIPVIVGVPLGTLLLRSFSRDFFTRFVMGVDGVIVSYGLSQVLVKLKWVSSNMGYVVMVVLFAVFAGLTYLALAKLPTLRHTAPERGAIPVDPPAESSPPMLS